MSVNVGSNTTSAGNTSMSGTIPDPESGSVRKGWKGSVVVIDSVPVTASSLSASNAISIVLDWFGPIVRGVWITGVNRGFCVIKVLILRGLLP